jgi:predicted nucleic acid-binding protein
MYVLDTDMFSITNPASRFGAAEAEAWREWVRRNEAGLFFSVVTIMEVRFGIEKSVAKGAPRKADQLRMWLTAAQTTYRNRILPMTTEVAHKAGELLYGAVASGAMPSSEDAVVAATAQVRGFRVLSRNGKHMSALQAIWFNPLEELPPDVNC